MTFTQPLADVFVPSSEGTPEAALARVTHLCVAAHPDDIEIMAHAGICDCLEAPAHRAFGGVVVTDGASSPRSGAYAAFSNDEMVAVRRDEQRRAATLGAYAIQIQLAHPSAHVKQPHHPGLAADLDQIFSGCRPTVVYLHNPADKHDTHVGLLTRCLAALRRQPPERRPERVLGCEVWRDLDWLVDSDKVGLDAGRREQLASDLLLAFDSQISGGKRYDRAALGRRVANATFHTSHATDRWSGITWAIDLTPLLEPSAPSLTDYTLAHVDRFRHDIRTRLERTAQSLENAGAIRSGTALVPTSARTGTAR